MSVAQNQNKQPLLQVHGLSAWYGAAQTLFDINLHVQQGEVVALMGRNGAGKSTTLKSLIGLMPQCEGVINFMGHDISKHAPHQIASLGLAFVPEDRRIFTDLTVAENLEVGRQASRSWPDGQEVPSWTPQALYTLFPNLAGLQDRLGGRMSGGEQQMLTISRALMGNPYLLLLDEPSEGMAPVIVEQMVHMIIELKRQGVSILLSEQNLHFAELVSDRVYVLEKGQIRFEGAIDALANAEDLRRSYLSI